MRISILVMAAALSLGLAACAVGDESTNDDAEVGAAAEAQIDPGQRGYVVYTITQNNVNIGTVLVTNTAGGGYAAKREYWYMTANPSMSSALSISGGAAADWSTPPSGLGTLSFTMDQQPVWTPSAIRGSLLGSTNPLTGEGVRINWQMYAAGSTGGCSFCGWTGYIVWYHTNTNNVFGPGTTNTLSPTTSHPGTWYSYVSTPL